VITEAAPQVGFSRRLLAALALPISVVALVPPVASAPAATARTTGITGTTTVPATVPALVPAPVARPTAVDLGFDGTVRDLLRVGSTFWLSHDDELDVFSAAGVLQHAFPLTGAGELALSADGTRVFAGSTSGVVRVWNSAAATLSATWATHPCPRHPTPLGDRLLYGYGCDPDPAGLAALDLTTGQDVPTGISDGFSTPPALYAVNDLLVALDGTAPTRVRSYARNQDGSISPLGTATPGTVLDGALSPDAAEVLLALADGTVLRLESSDLDPLAAATAPSSGSPSGVAYSPTGGSFAVGVGLSSLDQLLVFGAPSAALQSRSAQRSSGTAAANPAPLAGTLDFSADGTRLYALTHPSGQHVMLLTATGAAVAGSPITLRLAGPRRFGEPMTVHLVIPARPHTQVHLALVDSSGSSPLTANTDAHGRVDAAAQVDTNGRVTAAVVADLTHADAAVSAAFTVPAALDTQFTGYSSRRGGVLRYRSFTAVRGVVIGSPARAMRVILILQERTRRGWRNSAPAQPMSTDGNGLIGVTMGGGQRRVVYRLVVQFRGDRRNRAAPQVGSMPWMVG
jgi:hypothetical protein